MLKLKGQKKIINGGWIEFTMSDIYSVASKHSDWWIEKDGIFHAIDPSTIQLADDPRKAMLKTLRQRLLLESRPVLNDAYEGMLYLSDVNAILDEMEAKL